MRLSQLLLENRVDFLRQWFAQKGGDPQVFETILTADPSQKKLYTQWLLNLFLSGRLKLEDLYKATEYLGLFDRYKSQLPVRDINQIGTLSDLYSLVADFQPKQSERQLDRAERERIRKSIRVVYSGPEGKILSPTTQEASCYLGRGTQWCTAATESNNMFDHYNQSSPLYVILPADGRKFQFHLRSNQLMDENDNEYSVDSLWQNYPWVTKKIRFPPEEVAGAVKTRRFSQYGLHRLRDTNSGMWPQISDSIAQNPAIFFLIGQPPEIRKIVIAAHPSFIYLIYPTPEEREVAVKNDPYMLFNLNNPTARERLIAIEAEPYIMRLMIKRFKVTEKEKLVAAMKNGDALQYLWNQPLSPQVRLAALKSNPISVGFLGVQTPEEREAILKQKGPRQHYDASLLSYIKDLTPEEQRFGERMQQISRKYLYQRNRRHNPDFIQYDEYEDDPPL